MRRRLPGAGGGDIDDRTATGCLCQCRQRMLAAQEGAVQAGKAAVPLIPVQLRQCCAMRIRHAGIVDQAVDASETLESRGDQARGLRFARSIATHESAMTWQRPFLQAGPAGVGIQIADHHAAAGAQHRLRNAAADALRATGDHHHAALQW